MSAAYEPIPERQVAVAPTRQATEPSEARAGGASAGIALVGLCTMLVAAWGGIAPYVGPTFGYRTTGRPAWHWDLAHAVVAFAPGVVGVIAGLAMVAAGARRSQRAGSAVVALAGLVAVVAGAWFVVGPSAWPLLKSDARPYFAPTSAFHGLTNQVGSTLGPGTILCALGAFAVGWTLHRRSLADRVAGEGPGEPGGTVTRRGGLDRVR